MIDQGQRCLSAGQNLLARARLRYFLGEPDAEALARQAFHRFAAAMNFTEGWPEFDVAHFRLDEAGHWVRESFGCHLDYVEGTYRLNCPVTLSHYRVGLSPGMSNVERLCYVCGLDTRLCRHVVGRTYDAPMMMVSGLCNVCHLESCSHTPGAIYPVECWRVIVSLRADEFSFVPRPAQPMARVAEVEFDMDVLRATLGASWTPGMPVSCDRCQKGCQGLVEGMDAFHELAGYGTHFRALIVPRGDPCPPPDAF
jgi:hypothetical protein